jgi:dTDP-4-dehydrorhamnose reductase
MSRKRMRIFLLGNTGQLGWELERALTPLGGVTAIDYPQINFADKDDVRRALKGLTCDWIINATAYTQVDRAETEAGIAHAINASAPRLLAETAQRIGAAFLHFSTDYVFDGEKGRPYSEEDTPRPLGVYGRTKWMGEQGALESCRACLVLRTSCVYSLRRDCFVTRVLRSAHEKETLRYADDLIGSPTWARALAELSARMVAQAGEHPAAWLAPRRGVFHAAGEGAASRMEWARAVIALDPKKSEQLAREVLPAKAADFPTAAPRPLYSALDCGKLHSAFGLFLPPWQDALAQAMRDGGGVG